MVRLYNIKYQMYTDFASDDLVSIAKALKKLSYDFPYRNQLMQTRDLK